MTALTRWVMAAVLAAAVTVPAMGATIMQLEPSNSLANADWVVTPGAPVKVGLRASYMAPSTVDSPIVLQFTVTDTNDQTIQLLNYINAADGNVAVLNQTSVNWVEFDLVLVNLPQVPGLPFAQASFASPSGAASDRFSVLGASASALDFSGGTVSNGQTVNFSGLTINTNGVAGGIFYLELLPGSGVGVPEPCTLAALSVGLLGLLRVRKNRR